jgi:hypothetical protein
VLLIIGFEHRCEAATRNTPEKRISGADRSTNSASTSIAVCHGGFGGGSFGGWAFMAVVREVFKAGWQGDLLPGGGRFRLTAPVATAQGQPITGLVRNTYVVDKPTSTLGLGDGLFQGAGTHAAYEPARLDDPTATLRHRGSSAAPWTEVPRAEWAFADGEGAAFPGRPDPTKICLKGGFDPSQVYELIYTAKNPIIMGLGLSAIRNAASFFRHATKDDAGIRQSVGRGSTFRRGGGRFAGRQPDSQLPAARV